MYVRWPTNVTSKHTFSRQNLLSHGKTYFLTAKLTFSRQNLPSHGKTYFLTAKHTFSRQNLLSHGKTYFLTAKLTFSRQNLLSHGKPYFLTSKLGYQTVIRRNYHGKSLLDSRIKDLNLKRKRCAQRNCMTMFIEYDIENDQADGNQRNRVV